MTALGFLSLSLLQIVTAVAADAQGATVPASLLSLAVARCLDCHHRSIGDRTRLRRRGERLCTACHRDLLEGTEGGSVHPPVQGQGRRAGCLSCHDPGRSGQPRLLVSPGVELCRRCHEEVVRASRAATGHRPAAENCLTCHRPHGAAEKRLLKMPPGRLCAHCHAENPELIAAHLGANLEALTCTACHTPHGSGQPHLLARYRHAPAIERCDTCHEGSFDRLKRDGDSTLCLRCHDDVGQIVEGAEVPHRAFEKARCTACHNPHASPQNYLVKLPGDGVCIGCHDDKRAGQGELAHGATELIGCHACHESHGGSRAHLLRRDAGSELCLSCHEIGAVGFGDSAATRRLLGRFDLPAGRLVGMATLRLSADRQHDHPVWRHRVLGRPSEAELQATETTFAGELDCLTCHDPHQSRSPKLLRWDVASAAEACLHCHRK